MKVKLYDRNDTHFASFDMPELPRKDDLIEIGFPAEQVVKTYVVWRVIHKMIQLPAYETKYVEGVPVQCKRDYPWEWEIRLVGDLQHIRPV